MPAHGGVEGGESNVPIIAKQPVNEWSLISSCRTPECFLAELWPPAHQFEHKVDVSGSVGWLLREIPRAHLVEDSIDLFALGDSTNDIAQLPLLISEAKVVCELFVSNRQCSFDRRTVCFAVSS